MCGLLAFSPLVILILLIAVLMLRSDAKAHKREARFWRAVVMNERNKNQPPNPIPQPSEYH